MKQKNPINYLYFSMHNIYVFIVKYIENSMYIYCNLLKICGVDVDQFWSECEADVYGVIFKKTPELWVTVNSDFKKIHTHLGFTPDFFTVQAEVDFVGSESREIIF